jgi:LysM repeat protein/lysophospholipase L1-like esterase
MLPDSSSSIHIQMLRTAAQQSQFEFYGMSLESETGEGLVYHSLGVGGAPYTSLLKELLLDSQLPTLKPDLVILDFGTNDFLYSERIPSTLDRDIIQSIRWIRQLVPDVTILLTSTQDMDRHGRNVAAAGEFAALIRRIARMEGCALYDWYRVSGGQYSMNKWVEERLARGDHIHLTTAGYSLKGKLFSAALQATIDSYFTEPGLDSLVLVNPKADSVHVDSLIHVAPRRAVTSVRHQIRSGESLSTIAEKYGVKVSDIMRVNKLSSTQIIAGNYLTIEYNAEKAVPKKILIDPNAIRYKVRSGDTLSEIAEKFIVSVKSIR